MDALTASEQQLINKMTATLDKRAHINRLHESYYDGSFATKLLNISAPEHLARMLKTVAGWAGTAVDVLEERLDLLDFADTELTDVFTSNALSEEASQVHLDAMIYGVGFVSVTAGGEGEPDPLILGHDAKNTTGVLNPRTRRLDAAFTRTVNTDDEVLEAELWLPDSVVSLRRERHTRPWVVTDRQTHNLGVVPVVPFINRGRTGSRWGRSEISAALRRYTDSAVRTLIAMDVNREFFSVPQRYAIGIDSSDFVDPSGAPKSQWQILTGSVWTTGRLDDGEEAPKLGEFNPQPAGPFLQQIEGLAQLAAAEAGVPGHYFGLRSDQASSADAIRAMEARLVKRAERRQTSFGRSWGLVGQLAKAAMYQRPADLTDFSSVRWGNPATPTVGATMDAMVKAVQAGLAPGNSRVIWDRVGFTPEEQRLLEQSVKRQQAHQSMQNLAAGAMEQLQQTTANPDTGLDDF